MQALLVFHIMGNSQTEQKFSVLDELSNYIKTYTYSNLTTDHGGKLNIFCCITEQ